MIIGFSTHWPKTMPAHMAGKETCFVDKIWLCLNCDNYFVLKFCFFDWQKYFDEHFKKFKNCDPFVCNEDPLFQKSHTIRRDEKNRWKAGNDINFVVGNRTLKRFQFAPVVKCVSVQKIEIKVVKEIQKYYSYTVVTKLAGETFLKHFEVFVDDVLLDKMGVEQLATNDGFNSCYDFFSWFKEDFTGKIIHWTDLKY